MINDPGTTYDGWRQLDGGMDSSNPDLSEANQAALLVNCQIRDGFPSTRPAYLKRTLTFDTGIQSAFEDAFFQGAGAYVSQSGVSHLVAAIGGRHFTIRLSDDSYTVTEITPEAGNPNIELAWIEQAEDFAIIQDGQSKPVIWDGSSARQAGASEIPTGSALAYGQGRIWQASADNRFFAAGDLVYGTSGSSTYGFRDAVLKWTENDFLTGGGAFTVSHNKAKISAMAFLSNLDTALGNGPLIVGTPKGLFSVSTPIDREAWQLLQYPPQTIAHLGSGPVGPRQIATVNGDLWYRGFEGIYSFSMARKDFNSWINTPMSEEISRLLKGDSQRLLEHGSMVNWNNYLLTTVRPTRNQDNGVTWDGLAVLDFAPTSRMRGRTPPAWAGLWTGLRILQVCTVEVGNEDRCFLFALDTNDKISLWEIREDERFDRQSRAIESIIESRLLKGEDQGNGLKYLESGALWIDQLASETEITASYRPDSDVFWQTWHSWSACANYQDCTPDPTTGPKALQQQYRTRKRLPTISRSSVDTITGKPYADGHHFQVRLTIAGHFRLRMFRAKMRHLHEDPMGSYPLDEDCTDYTGCLTDIFSYSSEL